MKTSTLIATLAISCGFLTITAANLKLRSEYNKGKLTDPYVKQSLPPFTHIKDITDTGTLKQGRFEIKVAASETPGVATYYASVKSYDFTVKNDTLYIGLDKTDQSTYSHWLPMIITTKKLESVDVVNGEYNLKMDNSGDLSITAIGKSTVEVKGKQFNTLSVNAQNEAAIGLSVKDTINKLNIRLNDQSSLNAKNLFIGERTLQLGPRANLQLSGRSIENFGIKNANP